MTTAEVRRQLATKAEVRQGTSEPTGRRGQNGDRPFTLTTVRADGVVQRYHVSRNHRGPGGMTPEDALCG